MPIRKYIMILAALALVVPSCGGDDNGTGPGPGDTVSPAAISDLAVGDATENSLVLTWTAPGDDDTTGTAAVCDVRYSTASITDPDWDSATQVSGEPSPKAAGSSESFTISGLTSNKTYYFAVKTADEASNWSAISNVADGTTQRGESDSWEVTFGGAGDDVGRSVAATPDGGQVVAGWTESFGSGGADVYLFKTDAVGNMVWDATFGGAQDDKAEAVAVTTDGYIISGYTSSFGAGGQDIYVIRTNTSGDSIWTRTFGTAEDDLGMSVAVADDGGYVIAGYRQKSGGGDWDVYVIKIDAAGDSVWAKTFGGANDDYAKEIKATADGGFIVAGSSRPAGSDGNAYLIKINAVGDRIWEITPGDMNDDAALSITTTQEGGYLAVGYTNTSMGWQNLYVAKIGAQGNKIWDWGYGGAGAEIGRSVVPAGNGEYVIAGSTESFAVGGADVFVVKVEASTSANIVWTQKLGGTEDDHGYGVAQAADGGFVVVGSTTSTGAGGEDIYLIKVDADGQL